MKFCTVITLIFLMSQYCFAQDVITTKKGEDIFSKVVEITLSEIKYRKHDNLSGPLISILKSDVMLIRYENGTKDVFNQIEQQTAVSAEVDYIDNFHLGQQDAQKYYKGYHPAANGTLATGILLSPLLGLVPAFATIGDEPKEINLNYPDPKKFKNTEYKSGYKAEAYKIKKTKVWTNWGIACGVNLLLFALFL